MPLFIKKAPQPAKLAQLAELAELAETGGLSFHNGPFALNFF